EGEEEEEDEDGGPGSALEKSPFQLTASDVYDISSVVGRDLLQLRAGPQLPATRARLQFRIVRVGHTGPGPRPQHGHTTRGSRSAPRITADGPADTCGVFSVSRTSLTNSLGPDQMVIDLTDPNRPRFTLQELRDVLQERNQLKAQLLVVQEELQCYKSGIISQKRDQTEELGKKASGSSAGTSKDNEDKTIIKRLFSFKHGK
ncbi:RIPL2 protein, partial [Certhia brachydactyla]|nr:RIPL2 protein [Certhia brachydactyla]